MICGKGNAIRIKVLGFLFSLCLLFVFSANGFAPCAAAAEPLFAISLDGESYSGGETVKLTLDAGQTREDVAGFCVSVDYDDTRLEFLRVEPSSQIKSKTLQTDGTGNPVRSTYVCNVDLGYAPPLCGTVLTYVFEVKEGASAGETELEAVVNQVCNWKGEQTDRGCAETVSLDVLPAKSCRAYLRGLEPSSGKLRPAFSPDIQSYELDVPYRVSSVEFQAEAGENGTVGISRKTLQRAGTTTSITVTVTSEDKKQRVQYVVAVNRAAEPEEEEWAAYLTALAPSAGVLQPAFSEDITEYTLDVGADVQSVTFRANAGEDGSVSASRQKLNRAGTPTEIRITVVSADKKNRQVYVVTVNRAEEGGPVPAAREDFFLTALQPSVGILEPSFSPDTLDYTLAVDAGIQSVSFRADATEGATVSINRRMLYKAGSTTEIIATVRSSDKKETKQYIVSVLRASEESAAPAALGKNSVGKGNSSTGSKTILSRPVTWSEADDAEESGQAYVPEPVQAVRQSESLEQGGEPEAVPSYIGGESKEPVLREGNQFPVFLSGMGAAVLCIALGIAIALLFERWKIKKS